MDTFCFGRALFSLSLFTSQTCMKGKYLWTKGLGLKKKLFSVNRSNLLQIHASLLFQTAAEEG